MRYLLGRVMKPQPKGNRKAYFTIFEEFRQTVFRQTLFAEFEWQHISAPKKVKLDRRLALHLYANLLDDYYGSATKIDDYMK